MSRKIVVATLVAAGLIGVFVYEAIFAAEVDSDANNAPFALSPISLLRTLEKPEATELAAGIAYDSSIDSFIVTTDQPHSVMPSDEAQLFILNSDFSSIESEITINTDGHLEGVAVHSAGRYIAVSEVGTLYVVERDDAGGLSHVDTIHALKNGDRKLGSLTFDETTKSFYAAEKEGTKRIYQLDESGELVDTFELTLPTNLIDSANRSFTLSADFTIAGMHVHDGQLLIFSEAYSALFQLDLATREVTSVWGIVGLPESAGITAKGDELFLIGDLEIYLPPPRIYVVSLPEKITGD